jgi:hypothetical protein
VAAASTCRQSHDVGRQHLPARTGGTEPRCFDDRVTEVVVVVTTDFSTAQANSQTQPLIACPVVTLDALLHRDRAGHCGRRGGEHDHEPVTQVLDFRAARLGDRAAQDREMAAAQLVGSIGRETRRQRGRAHDVGEQHRHVLGRQRCTAPASTPQR